MSKIYPYTIPRGNQYPPLTNQWTIQTKRSAKNLQNDSAPQVTWLRSHPQHVPSHICNVQLDSLLSLLVNALVVLNAEAPCGSVNTASVWLSVWHNAVFCEPWFPLALWTDCMVFVVVGGGGFDFCFSDKWYVTTLTWSISGLGAASSVRSYVPAPSHVSLFCCCWKRSILRSVLYQCLALLSD